VKCLGFHLFEGQHRFVPERKQLVCSMIDPKTNQQIRVFGSCGFLLNLDP
jgi:surfactin synthase thioesterase subunit